ncbi:MAG: hypothetical protein B7Z77_01915 [Acidocella sp. 20-58-15]|nr:MAG: hypothetical protein B7Z77_01915 [Acidocella sp. 20-58-15]
MTVLAWIMSMIFPLCGTLGANGITPPGLVDFTHLPMQGHSEYLAAPAGFTPTPGIASPIYHLPPAALFATLQAIAPTLPHTFVLDTVPQSLQAAYVIRSPQANFPDILELEVVAEPNNQSSVIIYSHSIYGESDYGKNHEHITIFLNALNAKVAP